ncbi:hypothetical protein ABK040_002657 [Willaertia magna]
MSDNYKEEIKPSLIRIPFQQQSIHSSIEENKDFVMENNNKTITLLKEQHSITPNSEEVISNNNESIIVSQEESLHIVDNNSTTTKEEGLNQKTPTPLPIKKLLVVFFMYLCDNMNSTSLFPYIAYMVEDFNLTHKPEEFGYYVGLIASAYYFSQLFSSIIWSSLSDKFGRRPIMLIGTSLGALAGLLFGFSKFFWWAIVARLLFGLLNGNLGVLKSYLGEITDSTNQARAFSFVSLTYALGSIIGPMIGGLFSRPTKQYPQLMKLFPNWIQSFLSTFPYSPPSMIISSLGMVGFTVGFLYLEESSDLMSKKKEGKKEESIETVELKEHDAMNENNVTNVIEDDFHLEEERETYHEQKDEVDLYISKKKNWKTKVKDFYKSIKEHEMFATRIPLLTCLLYMVLGFRQVIFDECFPLFSLLPLEKGGLGFTSYKLGIIGGILGVVIFFSQMFFIYRVPRYLGAISAFRLGVFVSCLTFIAFPELSWLATSEDSPFYKQILLWVVMIPLMLIYQIFQSIAFLSTFVLTNNSVTKKNAGKLNGTAMSSVALSRMFGPIVGGNLFSWSLSVGVFPIDRRFIYYFLLLVSGFILLISFLISKDIDIPKDELEKRKEEEKHKQEEHSEHS